MAVVLGKSLEDWEKLKADQTAKEIRQQPVLWLKILSMLEEKGEVFEFVRNFQEDFPEGRIILSGSGSSAYVGDVAAPFLHFRKDLRFISIPSTDLIISPDHYLNRKIPTLLISLSRSGNNPEGLGAYHLISEEIETYRHLVITCAKSGRLAQKAEKDPHARVIVTPPEAEDKGYTTTSGFTCLLLILLMLFEKGPEKRAEEIRDLATSAGKLLDTQWQAISALAKENYDRVLFIGTSAFKGLAAEGQLALLEMTSGKKVAASESTLGFRYNKRFLPDENSLTFLLFSSHPYTRQFEEDLLYEIYQNKIGKKVVAIAWKDWDHLSSYCDQAFFPVEENEAYPGSGYAALFYVLYLQLFAFFSAIHLGVSPDHPVPYGLNKHEPKRGKDFSSYSSFR